MNKKTATHQCTSQSTSNKGTHRFLPLVIRSAKEIHPYTHYKSIIHFIRFIITSFKHKNELQQFTQRLCSIELSKKLHVNTDMVGALAWPYLCNHWDVSTRFNIIAKHYEFIASLAIKSPSTTSLAFVRQHPLTLADLSTHSNKVSVVIDRPIWFRREGEIVLNLFSDELRVVSLAFVFGIVNKKPTITIGAIQGIHSGISKEESLLTFKKLTKDFYGLRPRALLIDLLKACLLYTSPSPRDRTRSRMPSSA